MKHQKEWYTCDRCGAEIKDDPKRLLNCICYMPRKYAKLDTITIDGINTSVNKIVGELESEIKLLGMDISYTYRSKTTELNLCPKCRKDFERFMKGEI